VRLTATALFKFLHIYSTSLFGWRLIFRYRDKDIFLHLDDFLHRVAVVLKDQFNRQWLIRILIAFTTRTLLLLRLFLSLILWTTIRTLLWSGPLILIFKRRLRSLMGLLLLKSCFMRIILKLLLLSCHISSVILVQLSCLFICCHLHTRSGLRLLLSHLGSWTSTTYAFSNTSTGLWRCCFSLRVHLLYRNWLYHLSIQIFEIIKKIL